MPVDRDSGTSVRRQLPATARHSIGIWQIIAGCWGIWSLVGALQQRGGQPGLRLLSGLAIGLCVVTSCSGAMALFQRRGWAPLCAFVQAVQVVGFSTERWAFAVLLGPFVRATWWTNGHLQFSAGADFGTLVRANVYAPQEFAALTLNFIPLLWLVMIMSLRDTDIRTKHIPSSLHDDS